MTKKPFQGRIEKIDSVFASLTSSIFTIKLYEELKIHQPVSFDVRIIPLDDLEQVLRYLIWRQLDNFRNFLNKTAQIILQKRGYSPRTTAKKLSGVKGKKLVKLIEGEYRYREEIRRKSLHLWISNQRKSLPRSDIDILVKIPDDIDRLKVLLELSKKIKNTKFQFHVLNASKGKTLQKKNTRQTQPTRENNITN